MSGDVSARDYQLGLIAELRMIESRTRERSAQAGPLFAKRGQLLPRERVARLLDPGTPFLELSTLAGWLQDTPDPDKSVAGGGLVVGIGMVSGTRVMLVADAIRRSRAGLSDPNRPYGSFLFLGPTGVGKTELCKALAQFLFDSEEQMVRIDMSEFMEKHSVSRLIGAPPGYVGYEEGGTLTEAVRRKPYSVILLDEVEKAHPDVFNVLLQVLDDGRLTDGQGRTVDFRNTVVVMTSNLGSHEIQRMAGSASAEIKDAVMAEVKVHFRPEFINRIDEIVVFHALDTRHIRDIAKIQLRYLEGRVAEREMRLEVSDAALDEIAKVGFDPLFGARPLKRAIQQRLENPIARLILEGKFGPKDVIPVDFKDGELSFDRVVH